jgi:hypothetical protein
MNLTAPGGFLFFICAIIQRGVSCIEERTTEDDAMPAQQFWTYAGFCLAEVELMSLHFAIRRFQKVTGLTEGAKVYTFPEQPARRSQRTTPGQLIELATFQ